MPSSQGADPAGGSATVAGAPAAEHVPQLIPGVELLGEYQGSGLTEATYLARKPGGQVVQVSRLLHLVLSGIDGRRTVSQIAGHATVAFGRTVSADNVDYLLASKLAPLGLVPRQPGEHTEHGEHRDARAGQDQPVLTLKLRRARVRPAGRPGGPVRRERRPGPVRHRRRPGDLLAQPLLPGQPGIRRPEGRQRPDPGHGPDGAAQVRDRHPRARASPGRYEAQIFSIAVRGWR